jgi:hypothetical protein
MAGSIAAHSGDPLPFQVNERDSFMVRDQVRFKMIDRNG